MLERSPMAVVLLLSQPRTLNTRPPSVSMMYCGRAALLPSWTVVMLKAAIAAGASVVSRAAASQRAQGGRELVVYMKSPGFVSLFTVRRAGPSAAADSRQGGALRVLNRMSVSSRLGPRRAGDSGA
jgi:hypothetical protein